MSIINSFEAFDGVAKDTRQRAINEHETKVYRASQARDSQQITWRALAT